MSKLHISDDLREYQRLWRREHREQLREYYRKYRADHPSLKQYHANYFRSVEKLKVRTQSEGQKQRRRQRDMANREGLRNAHRIWRAANAQQLREREKVRWQTRKGDPHKKATDRQWRENNPETFKSSILAAKAKRPEHYALINRGNAARRRSRKRLAPVEPVSLTAILARDQNACHLCGEEISNKAEVTLDHLIPVVRGGAWAEWNLMLAHGSCNKKRGTRQILACETKECALAYIAERAQ
jgi:5-methylcytosine-specific restriction endonuclease McrA